MICERCRSEFDESKVSADVLVNGETQIINRVQVGTRTFTLCQPCMKQLIRELGAAYSSLSFSLLEDDDGN